MNERCGASSSVPGDFRRRTRQLTPQAFGGLGDKLAPANTFVFAKRFARPVVRLGNTVAFASFDLRALPDRSFGWSQGLPILQQRRVGVAP